MEENFYGLQEMEISPRLQWEDVPSAEDDDEDTVEDERETWTKRDDESDDTEDLVNLELETRRFVRAQRGLHKPKAAPPASRRFVRAQRNLHKAPSTHQRRIVKAPRRPKGALMSVDDEQFKSNLLTGLGAGASVATAKQLRKACSALGIQGYDAKKGAWVIGNKKGR